MSLKNYDDFVSHMRKLADLESTISVLHWDKEVNLPKKGADFRSQQIATLSGIAHELFTDKKFESNLYRLNENGASLNDRQKKNVKLTIKQFEKVKKLDKEFVIKRTQLISKAYHSWIEARAANDFKIFKGPLAALIENKKEEAERIGYEEHPYDALLDEFEPECRTKDLDILFAEVKKQLIQFVQELRTKTQVDDQFLHQHFPQQKQWNFGLEILKRIGYDFEAGRQDLSPHPFTINFSPLDVRVTTRVDESNFGSMTWSCIHEGGHALYEQGLPSDQYGLPLGKYLSLGIHESQSRLWENNVGRSRSFWKAHYSFLQSCFPDKLKEVSLDQFFKGINKIQPSLIRVESDELHYHFHILIRYEIEKCLIEGSLSVDEVKDAWNQKYKAYLNLDVPDDKQGILQDIHWAHGSLGYFPTYSLGSFYAAQFFHQAKIDIPDLQSQIEEGNNQALLKWLREKVHQHGRFFTAEELCKKITGEPLNFQYFMDYAREKYAQVYQ